MDAGRLGGAARLLPLGERPGTPLHSRPSALVADQDALAQFNAQLPHLYPLATHLLAREMDADVRENVRAVLVRVGETKLGIA